MNNIMNYKKLDKEPRIAGDLRVNQLLITYGIGSIIDFVRDSVILSGIDEWDISDKSRYIYNENLQSITGKSFFVRPKTEEDLPLNKKSRDIPSYIFPEKLYCPKCYRLFDIKELQYRTNPHECLYCKNKQLVASRFVVVCENGHIEDFPYSWWAHKGGECKSSDNPRLKLFNLNNRSDMESLIIKCEACQSQNFIIGAFSNQLFKYKCNCNHPHLPNKKTYNDTCANNMKTRLRSSSSTYFPVIQSALSIPPWSRKAVQIIQAKYEELKYMSDENTIAYIKEVMLRDFRNITFKELKEAFNIVKKQRNLQEVRTEADIYFDEYNMLCKGTAEQDEEFSMFEVDIPIKYNEYIDKIVVVDRLTEVQALCGFTRLEPWSRSGLDDRRIVPLSTEKRTWLPAVKMKGEGIFIRFNHDLLERWSKDNKYRYMRMQEALDKSYYVNRKFSPKYVLMHTFSHILIRQLSTECGYSVASLKEKIYSDFYEHSKTDCHMDGILIYLASSDSDGSLGGLISIARSAKFLEGIFDAMINKAQWCSADPLCINSLDQGAESLNYAACHDCVLLPETSCEFRNILLDRVSIVGEPDNKSIGLFSEIDT